MCKIIKKKEFRLQAKNLFLTYSRCDISIEKVIKLLYQKLINYKIINYVLAVENHATQKEKSTHIHVYVGLEKALDTRNQNFLDLHSNEEIFHGNYQTTKNASKCIEYILKDVFDISNTDQVLISDKLKAQVTNAGYITYKQAMINLAKKGQIAEAMELLEKNDTNSYLKSHMSIEKSLRGIALKSIGYVTKFNMDNFIAPIDLTKSIINAMDNKKTFYLRGNPGTGKSEFIRSFVVQQLQLNPCVINNVNAIRTFIPNVHTCILMDDCNFETLNREEIIRYLDSANEATIRVTYGDAIIPEGIPRFIISNKTIAQAFCQLNDVEQDHAIMRRIAYFDLKDIGLYEIIKKDDGVSKL